jgi:hypothetical protein
MAEQQNIAPSPLRSSAAESPDLKQSGNESMARAPVDPKAMVDSSQFADVDWERSLQGRLEDVVHYGLTILPHEELYSLAIDKASSKAWPMRELQRYLSNRLRYPDSALQESRDRCSEYVDRFSGHICHALEYCCTHQDDWDRREGLWVYVPTQTEPPTLRRLPDRITSEVRNILEMLRRCISPRRRAIFEQDSFERDQFEEDARLWVAQRVDNRQPGQSSEGEANAGREINLGALTEEWRKEGYHEHLLRGYVWYRMIKEAPSRQYEIDFLVGQLFDKPWEARRWKPSDDRNDGCDLRIHYAR